MVETQKAQAQRGNVQQVIELPVKSTGGLSHETQSDVGLCSVVIFVVVNSEAQHAPVAAPPDEKKVRSYRCSSVSAMLQRLGGQDREGSLAYPPSCRSVTPRMD